MFRLFGSKKCEASRKAQEKELEEQVKTSRFLVTQLAGGEAQAAAALANLERTVLQTRQPKVQHE